MKYLKKILYNPLESLLCIILVSLVIISFSQVIFRYVLHTSLSWSEESCRFLLMWLGMLSAAYGFKIKAHFSLSFIKKKFSANLSQIVTILTTVLMSIFLVIFIFTLDRLSKIIIIKLSAPLNELNISVTSFINFNLIWNEGIAFGLLSFDDKFYYNLITLLIALITSIIIWLANKSKGVEKLGFLMIVGGSLGNLFDRIYYSSVPDFIDISINNFHWFIFNVADIFITIGVILLIILEFFKKKKL